MFELLKTVTQDSDGTRMQDVADRMLQNVAQMMHLWAIPDIPCSQSDRSAVAFFRKHPELQWTGVDE